MNIVETERENRENADGKPQMLVPIPESIPEEMRGRDQWINWKLSRNPKSTGKPWTKIPLDPKSGRKAATTRPETWTDFDTACRVHAKYAAQEGKGRSEGLGYVLRGDHVGIDLDGCLDPQTGELESWAQEIIDAISSYTEASPSGTGIRIFCRGRLPEGRRRCGRVEMYDESSPRYLTVTGHKRGSQTLLLHSQCALEVIHARYLGAEEIEGTKLAPACAPPPDDLDTERILEKATTAANGEKFSKLWRGEWQGDYPSQSEADLALAGSLAFWCGRDPEAIDTMFRRSGLYRDKWERADYREGTIAKAMERDRFYDWGADGEAVEAVVTGGSLPLPSGNGQATGDKPDIVKEIEEAKAKKPPPSFTRMMSSAELEELDQKNAFLIEDVLVKGQPLVFGGPGKAMKTSVSVDFAVSLGSATPFLGKFAVPRKVRVAFWTGESGEMTIKETAIRIAKSKGRRLRDCSVDWSFDLPKLCRPDHLTALREHIASRQYEVVIVDPLYLSLLSAENAGLAGNVYAMGAALSPVGEMGKYSGCTVCLIHHFKKIGTGDVNNPCALEDLSQSGISEWARQWILLQRRTPYTSDGTHELWMRLGGSAGHASLNALTIDEGLLDSKTMSGRHWRVQVRSQSQAISEEKTRKAEEKATAAEKENAVLSAKVVEYLKTRPDGETARVMRTALGLGEAKMRGVLGALLLSATIAECQIRKTNASFPGYKLA